MRVHFLNVAALIAAAVVLTWVGVRRPPATAPAAANTPTASPPADKKEIEWFITEQVDRKLPAIINSIIDKKFGEPKPETESHDARENATMSTLQTIRSQIELYKIQHADTPPSLEQLRSWDVMLNRTDISGAISAKGIYGPYFQQRPLNPLNMSSVVVAVGAARDDAGWVYKAEGAVFEFRAVLPADLAKDPSYADSANFEVTADNHKGSRTY